MSWIKLLMDWQTDSRARSCITLQDMNTKIGTIINGEKIRGESRVLDKVDNKVQLGKYPHLFR
jgi:nijmegen breakage syndrome protein 1